MDPDAAGAALLGMRSSTGAIPELSETTTKAEYIIAMNKLIRDYNQRLTLTVQADSSGINRFMYGYQKDGWGSGKDFGIKISKAGYNVLTAADADLLFKLAY